MPLVTVVIPTRNRLKYLKDSLQSALDQNDPDLEIIVADNATDDGTREYLATLGDRIRVTRTEEALSMSDNWARTFDMITGEWVIFIGDDDCLMPTFMADAKRLIAGYPQFELFHWDLPNYRWPDATEERERNLLKFGISNGDLKIDAKDYLRGIFDRIENVLSPPGLYHALSKISIMNRVKEKWGEYRVSKVPDLGSGILTLSHIDYFVESHRPLSVMAFGAKSTGLSFKTHGKAAAPAAEFFRLSQFDTLKDKYHLMDLDNPDVVQWRLLLEWSDYLASKGSDIKLNTPKMLGYSVSRVPMLPPHEHEHALAEYTKYARENSIDMETFDALVKQVMAKGRGAWLSPMLRSVKIGDVTKIVSCIDLSATPICTATGAAKLIAGYFSR